MGERRFATYLLAATATIVTALGVCALAASVMTSVAGTGLGEWVLAGGGFVALLIGLWVLWMLMRRRDRFLY